MLSLSSAHYRCTGCGDCCRNWHIPLWPDEAAKFREQAKSLIPAERLKKAFTSGKKDGVFIEALAGPGAACPMLQDDQLCAIHGKLGAAAKPSTCQTFPYLFVQTPTEVRVGLSYACPAVIDAEGTTLAEQRGEIEALFNDVVAGKPTLRHVPALVALADGVNLSWAQANEVLQALAAAFASETTFLRQVGRACAVALLLESQLEDGSGFGDALKTAVDGSEDLLQRALAEPLAIDKLSQALLRTLVKNSSSSGDHRLSAVVTSLFGGGQVALRSGGRVDWSAVEATAPGIPVEAQAILARWFGAALDACLFFGDCAFGLGIGDGLDLLVMSSAVAVFLARAEAAHAGRREANVEDVKRGLRQVSTGVTHRGTMPSGFARALRSTATLDLLREQLGAAPTG